MTNNDTSLLELAKQFFTLRAKVLAYNTGNLVIPVNVIHVGPAGHLVVVGEGDNLSLAFYDFTKSKEHYAELSEHAVLINNEAKPGMLAVALQCAIISTEWFTHSILIGGSDDGARSA